MILVFVTDRHLSNTLCQHHVKIYATGGKIYISEFSARIFFALES